MNIVHVSILAAADAATPADAQLLADAIWVHDRRGSGLDHVYSRAGLRSVDVVLFVIDDDRDRAEGTARSLCELSVSASPRFSGWRVAPRHPA